MAKVVPERDFVDYLGAVMKMKRFSIDEKKEMLIKSMDKPLLKINGNFITKHVISNVRTEEDLPKLIEEHKYPNSLFRMVQQNMCASDTDDEPDMEYPFDE